MLSTTVKIVAFLATAWCWTSEAQKLFYDVACPGINGELLCPEKRGIFVVAMNQGVQSDAACEIRDQPAQVSDNCINPMMLAWAKKLCNTKQYCKLPRPNPRMFQCESSPDTFYQVSYRCIKIPDVKTAVVCEGESQTIQCEQGTFRVVHANFGRNEGNTCTNTPSKHIFCTSDRAQPAVRELCQDQKECTLTATTEQFGEPVNCDDNPFYLSVDYVCM